MSIPPDYILFKNLFRDFSGSLVVKTPCFHSWGRGSIHGWETKILHAMWHSQKKKKKRKKERKKLIKDLLSSTYNPSLATLGHLFFTFGLTSD